MLSFASRFGLAASAVLVAVACTTTHTEIRQGPAAGDGGTGTGPAIDSATVGGACSGFGTGIGQTAAFETEDCPGSVCLVDAREGLDLYCSADCTNATCPTGWECQAVDNGAPERVCFKTPGATEEDAGPVATTGFDAPLTGYKAGASTSSTFAISSFKDPQQLGTDLIVLVVSGSWSIHDQRLMEDLQTETFTKTVIVSVLADGPNVGKGATTADLTTWHKEYPKYAAVLDSNLAVLKSEIGGIAAGEIEAFPTLIGLDAATLKEVDRGAGYSNMTDLKAMLDAWRAKTK